MEEYSITKNNFVKTKPNTVEPPCTMKMLLEYSITLKKLCKIYAKYCKKGNFAGMLVTILAKLNFADRLQYVRGVQRATEVSKRATNQKFKALKKNKFLQKTS